MNIKGKLIYLINGKQEIANFRFDKPFVNINLEISAIKDNSIYKVLIKPIGKITILDCFLEVIYPLDDDDTIFLNGYQSWTDSREFHVNESILPLNKALLPITSYYKMKYYGDYSFYDYTGKKGVFHSYTYTYVKKASNLFLFWGSLTEKKGFTIFEYNISSNILTIKKECKNLEIEKEYQIFELLYSEGCENEVFSEYFSNLKINKKEIKDCKGWTSWYNYYTNITQENILENLEAFSSRKIPIDIFQIDDGWQSAVGDWTIPNEKFTNSMNLIAEKIAKAGYKAGLWLAPFICEKKSKLYKEHFDWILKDEKRKPVVAGYGVLWSGDFYALDIYNNDFREYLKKVFDVILNEWKFSMVKLDFLYAACIIPRKNKTRGEVMSDAMEFLREIIGDKIILGCGVPLGPSFGIVDYCRIGGDVSLKWEDNVVKFLNYRERVSTFNSLSNTIGRRHLNNNVFLNDPDVFILRNENNKLTEDEKYTLFFLNQLFGGLVFTSDNINNYNDKQLKLYLSQFPNKKRIIKSVFFKNHFYKIDFSVESNDYKAYANLSNNSVSIKVNRNTYFYKDKFYTKDNIIQIKPHQTICLKKVSEEECQILYSTGHIFPGAEIDEFIVNGDKININFNPYAVNGNEITLKIPDKISVVYVNDKKINTYKLNNFNLAKYYYK